MKKALLKANIIFKESYDFPIISLTSRESIEDFIIKIYDLGFSEKREFPNFLEIGLDKKIEIEELVQKTSWNKFYFIKVFTKFLGETPYQYILNLKI